MKVVFDTNAFIYLSDFRGFEEIFTVSEVLDEVKDRVSSFKLSSLSLTVEEPDEESLAVVIERPKQTGDIEELSRTDLKVLALALSKRLPIVSDDRNVQNVAKALNLQFIPVFSKGIKEFIVWKKFCKNCKRVFPIGIKECPICGSRLKRVVWRRKRIQKVSHQGSRTKLNLPSSETSRKLRVSK